MLDALGSHGDLVVDLVPELKLIVGEPEPIPELPAADAQRHFQLLLRRFIGVFAQPEHPLALFFDDLQWLDAATLDLFEDLLTHECVPHLLRIGAYRDNEVDASHPLMRKLGSIKAAGVSSVEEIKLGALDARHISQLIADALHYETDRAKDLAELILQKTDGNPFFVNQFLSALTGEGLIAFDAVQSRWSWDLKRIHAKGYTENVVDMMIGKLIRLPAATQQALQHLACLGNIATTAMLAMVNATTEQELHASLLEARRQELVDFLENAYRFVHDRIHEAAYALIPTERRAAMHLRVGKMLVADTPPDKLDETIFEIGSQLNRASSLLTARQEREQLAEFNLLAGKRAQASSAYVSALNYLSTGVALLTEDRWQQRRELRFALELARPHCEFASEMIAQAEERLRGLSDRAVTTGERVAVTGLQVDLYQGIDRSNEAVAMGLRALRHLGVDLPERPAQADARHAYDGIWTRLGARAIEDLIHLPLMRDPDSLAALDLLLRLRFVDDSLDCRAVVLAFWRIWEELAAFQLVQLHLATDNSGCNILSTIFRIPPWKLKSTFSINYVLKPSSMTSR